MLLWHTCNLWHAVLSCSQTCVQTVIPSSTQRASYDAAPCPPRRLTYTSPCAARQWRVVGVCARAQAGGCCRLAVAAWCTACCMSRACMHWRTMYTTSSQRGGMTSPRARCAAARWRAQCSTLSCTTERTERHPNCGVLAHVQGWRQHQQGGGRLLHEVLTDHEHMSISKKHDNDYHC